MQYVFWFFRIVYAVFLAATAAMLLLAIHLLPDSFFNPVIGRAYLLILAVTVLTALVNVAVLVVEGIKTKAYKSAAFKKALVWGLLAFLLAFPLIMLISYIRTRTLFNANLLFCPLALFLSVFTSLFTLDLRKKR